ncbi:serine/threonine protein kinase [Mycobacterium sp. ACS1612]|uniref:serine/threonine-protein kinase n=1 Tax=Mycobacterium sp. ACS1612 TaxID=1834117 RepID=UPI000801A2C5|nr:serine/threonine-protein kinase [Mycobacterium sp. ACS1612]OBF25572.1 serine/threonine protein kinase [Mycobacterium sp. ACS1612]
MSLEAGHTFAGYTIIQRLGSGAMGEVYLAQHPRLPRRDAVKVLAQQVSTDTTYRERFNREARNASTLSHPNIVAVYDRGEHDGRLWISMAYVEGTDAARLLQERYRKGMPPDEVARIIAAVADALDYAHQRQLLHRDVKPANILLAELDSGGWRAMLADFGIARRVDDTNSLTETNIAVGTVAYAAPEQLMGLTLDGRADQYSLAATAFELLTGSHLYLDPNPAVVISRHVSAPPPEIAERKPELSALGPVLCKALAKSPDDRYSTCMDFARALARHLDVGLDEFGADDATLDAMAVAHRRNRVEPKRWARPWLIASAAVAVLLVAAAVAAVLLFERPRDEASPAPAVPVVLVGADCAVLGAAGVTESGQQAYCARLPTTGDIMWSLVSGVVPTPTVTNGPDDPVYPAGIEQQVDVCVQQTGKPRVECREDVRRGNLTGPA